MLNITNMSARRSPHVTNPSLKVIKKRRGVTLGIMKIWVVNELIKLMIGHNISEKQ